MKQSKSKLSGTLFLIASFIFILSGLLGKRPAFTILGFTFSVIGGGILSKSKKQDSK
ncbi:MAG: hypothetical protein PHW79_09510 [Candidatus Marinimicrobia bacterium]|nr:hypothetical protein [Candidatus Neomarinimicrobiota bacterium]